MPDQKIQASSRSIGQDRHTTMTNKDVEDMQRRAQGIFEVLADRKMRSGEGEALRVGFTRREDGDTNWMCVSTAAELAKAGFEVFIATDGESIIRKTKKG